MFKIKNRRWITLLIGTILAMTLCGCAAGPNDRVYYAFRLMVDDSLSQAMNIHYRYGELGEHFKPSSKSNGDSIIFMRLDMTIPDDFEVSWDTPDGKQHHRRVPVRSRIKDSVKSKSVLFLTLYDDVRGYISTSTPMGEKRERFY